MVMRMGAEVVSMVMRMGVEVGSQTGNVGIMWQLTKGKADHTFYAICPNYKNTYNFTFWSRLLFYDSMGYIIIMFVGFSYNLIGVNYIYSNMSLLHLQILVY